MMEEILPQLYRIIVPLPRNPLKEVNSWVFTTEDRNLIIDTGMNRKECSEVLLAGLEELGVDLEKTDFIVTHLHADHLGLVSSLARENATIYMGRLDASMMESGGGWHRMTDFARRGGFPEEELQAAISNHPGYKYGPQQKMEFTYVGDGEIIQIGDYSLECVETPGHSQGHICLYDQEKKILFSGDHILIDITPNIQCWSHEEDTLRQYIESLNKVNKLPMELVLPGHRRIIEDPRGRIEELKTHHRNRCNEVLSILEEGDKNAYQVASKMTWDITYKTWDEFPVSQKWFATGEANAHLVFLEGKDLIKHETRNVLDIYSVNGKARLESVD
ncbi:MAG: MBL fold metallo-hydrolase [Deltaproteobacteria bacterium]|nr:MBL fold metallo-hydrolase [Deltaproteobacteria bacterium]